MLAIPFAPSIFSSCIFDFRRLTALPCAVEHRDAIRTAAIRELQSLSRSQGTYWEYYALSNGGFYMAPVAVADPSAAAGFAYPAEALLTADAVGIVATLCGIAQVRAECLSSARLDNYFRALHAFAEQHVESDTILALLRKRGVIASSPSQIPAVSPRLGCVEQAG